MLKLSGSNDILWKVVRNQAVAQGPAVQDVHRKNKQNTNTLCTLYFTVFSLSNYLCFPKVLQVDKVTNIFVS